MIALLMALAVAPPDSLMTVHVPGPPTKVQQAVVRTMTAEGLILSAGTSPGLVVAEGTERKGMVDVRYTASLVGDSTATDVTLSAVATAKAKLMGVVPEARVTSKTGGDGKKVWARLQRIASALSPQ